MPKTIATPEYESKRLECLHSYQILDSLKNESFDRFTDLATQLFETPIALISMIDADRQWIKSAIGIEESEYPRKIAFCSYTICNPDIMVVEDTFLDERFTDNPFVTNSPAVRAYAGAPLISPEGYAIGTIGVVDLEPRRFEEKSLSVLKEYAAAVMDLIASHRNAIQAKASQQYLVDAVNALTDGFVIYDADDKLVLCNEAYREIYQESADLLVPGTTFEEIIRSGVANGQYPEASGKEEDWIAERLRNHRNPPAQPFEQQLPGDRWLRIRESFTYDGGLVGFRFDITELKRNQRKLAELAWTDSLTGVLNRGRFFDLVSAEINRVQRNNGSACILAIDIDKFKRINDNYGHAAGDKVLKELSSRWTETLRDYDFIGRLGGEEFVIYLPDTDLEAADIIAERLRSVTSMKPVYFRENAISVTISIGIAIFSQNLASLEKMISAADTALYAAKNTGRNRVCQAAA